MIAPVPTQCRRYVLLVTDDPTEARHTARLVHCKHRRRKVTIQTVEQGPLLRVCVWLPHSRFEAESLQLRQWLDVQQGYTPRPDPHKVQEVTEAVRRAEAREGVCVW